MRYRCRFAGGVTRIAFGARIAGITTCGSPRLPGLSDLTPAGWGTPAGAELWEPT